MMSLPTDPDCYWVESGLLLAGEYPGSMNEEVARARLRALLDCGVRTFIDLTEHDELESYDEVLFAEADARGVTVSYHRKSIQDLGTPSAFRMRDILAAIKASVERGDPVYVHCWGGIGRTGTVVGCWLTERGQANDDAIAAIAALRKGIRKCGTPSPETSEQVAFVREWPASRIPNGGSF
jgi:Protein-tyrosine phosphatase